MSTQAKLFQRQHINQKDNLIFRRSPSKIRHSPILGDMATLGSVMESERRNSSQDGQTNTVLPRHIAVLPTLHCIVSNQGTDRESQLFGKLSPWAKRNTIRNELRRTNLIPALMVDQSPTAVDLALLAWVTRRRHPHLSFLGELAR